MPLPEALQVFCARVTVSPECWQVPRSKLRRLSGSQASSERRVTDNVSGVKEANGEAAAEGDSPDCPSEAATDGMSAMEGCTCLLQGLDVRFGLTVDGSG